MLNNIPDLAVTFIQGTRGNQSTFAIVNNDLNKSIAFFPLDELPQGTRGESLLAVSKDALLSAPTPPAGTSLYTKARERTLEAL